MKTWLCCLLLGGCNWAFGIKEQPPLPPDAPPPPPGRWTSVSAGADQVCAIDVDGTGYCWGADRRGQTGTGGASLVPKSLGPAMWLAIAAGPAHSCGIQSDGKPWCWGADDVAQTTGVGGSDVAFPRVVAVPVGAPAFESIGMGLRHTCAYGAGQIFCWGDPVVLGAGGMSSAPTKVAAATWTSMSVGFDHTCAIDTAGGAWCWGRNDYGQLGGPSGLMPVPVGLPGTAVALAIAAGRQFSCAVVATTPQAVAAKAGEIWCWGSNAGDVIGTSGGQIPAQVIGGEDWTGIAAGNVVACGLRAGMATCWGTAANGGLGDGMWSETIAPTAALQPFRADAVTIGMGYEGEENNCALADHDLACWGDNRGGQLGTPATLHEKPEIVTAPDNMPWTSVAVGTQHTCARTAANASFCWGANDLGQVTGAASLDQPMPVAAPQPTTSGELVAGLDFTCGRNDNSTGTAIDCWGTNANGELGTPDPAAHTNHQTAASGTSIIGGARAVCETGQNTPFACWGLISESATRMPTVVPDPNNVLPGVYAVAFGDHAQCAISAGNFRVCWGLNYQAEFGDGAYAASTVTTPTMPVRVSDPTTYNMISLASRHACARTGGGAINCWGTDYDSETGDPNPDVTSQLTLVPHAVVGLSGCSRVSTTYDFSCAICDEQVSCWGALSLGRLGRDQDATGADATPAAVVTPSGSWIDLGSGGSHSCAVSSAGQLACWGFGVRGELGDGGHASPVPVAIATP